MRKFIEIDLHHQQISERQLVDRELAEAGRYLIARMLVERDIAPIDPLAPENPLIFQLGHLPGQIFPMPTACQLAVKARLPAASKKPIAAAHLALPWDSCKLPG